MSEDDLHAYVSGELARAANANVRAHLAHCSECWTRVESLEATMAQLSVTRSTMRLFDPPPATFDRARLLMQQIRPELLRASTPIQRRVADVRDVLATLIFDNQNALALGGLRSTAASTRQLSYESALADLDLQIAPLAEASGGERRWRVMGQLTTDAPTPGLSAEISPLRESAEPSERTDEASGDAVTAPLDEGGYFTVELAAERYALRIPLGDSILRFPDLDLR